MNEQRTEPTAPPTAPQQPTLTPDDLLLLIGRLFAENALLRAQLAQLAQATSGAQATNGAPRAAPIQEREGRPDAQHPTAG
jgi:hypothetical protein